MGTAYFADLVQQFGGAHFALATYNAGPGRVARGSPPSPGSSATSSSTTSRFPETQNYVKRILGTAEDYRRLYGSDALRPTPTTRSPAVAERPPRPPSRPRRRQAGADEEEAGAGSKKKTASAQQDQESALNIDTPV